MFDCLNQPAASLQGLLLLTLSVSHFVLLYIPLAMLFRLKRLSAVALMRDELWVKQTNKKEGRK